MRGECNGCEVIPISLLAHTISSEESKHQYPVLADDNCISAVHHFHRATGVSISFVLYSAKGSEHDTTKDMKAVPKMKATTNVLMLPVLNRVHRLVAIAKGCLERKIRMAKATGARGYKYRL